MYIVIGLAEPSLSNHQKDLEQLWAYRVRVQVAWCSWAKERPLDWSHPPVWPKTSSNQCYFSHTEAGTPDWSILASRNLLALVLLYNLFLSQIYIRTYLDVGFKPSVYVFLIIAIPKTIDQWKEQKRSKKKSYKELSMAEAVKSTKTCNINLY